MNARLTIRRPGRAAAVVGAVVAVGATAVMALAAGPANAAVPGRCVQNVNVRSQPDVSSRIVALCESGTAVQVGENRNGFVQLTDLGGWAAQEFVSVNGHTPAAPADRAAPTATPSATPAPTARNAPRNSTTTPAPTAGHRAPAPTTAPAPADPSDRDASAPDENPADNAAPGTGDNAPDSGTGSDSGTDGGSDDGQAPAQGGGLTSLLG